ncbi:Nodulin-like [Sesbania bispinosa]|nr:Nodulin-like [Sesbania bispinosa]
MPSTTFQWLSLVGIIWLQAINGTNTNFPAYSSQLKQLLSMSQVQLNNLAFASDAGKLFGCFSGIAAVYLPLWLVLMIGSTLGLIGYGNSICWINTVCYVVTIRNFSSDRQVAVGLTTSYQGLMSSLQFVSSKISPLGNLIGILVSLLFPLLVPVSMKISALVGLWHTKRERLRVYHLTVENQTPNEERTDNEVKEGENNREVQEIVFLNNLGQIAESRGCSGTSSLVSLSSSFGFFGRLMPSLMDYFYRGQCRISRPASMVALMAPIAGAFFLLLNKTHLALYISTAIIGVCTGAITSISVSTTTELFGTKNFSVNHNVLVANIPVGSFLFGYMAAIIYHMEGHEHGKCMGMECYRNTFIIWGSLCFFGTFLALILQARTRKFYSQKAIE